MAGMPGRSGRKPFVPTPEQRSNVRALAGSGMPQEQICRLVTNPPLDVKTLRKHFRLEIETAEIKLHALINNFTVANILGMAPPAGTRAIDNQARTRIALEVLRQDPDGLERASGEPPKGARRRSDRISGCDEREADSHR